MAWLKSMKNALWQAFAADMDAVHKAERVEEAHKEIADELSYVRHSGIEPLRQLIEEMQYPNGKRDG